MAPDTLLHTTTSASTTQLSVRHAVCSESFCNWDQVLPFFSISTCYGFKADPTRPDPARSSFLWHRVWHRLAAGKLLQAHWGFSVVFTCWTVRSDSFSPFPRQQSFKLRAHVFIHSSNICGIFSRGRPCSYSNSQRSSDNTKSAS